MEYPAHTYHGSVIICQTHDSQLRLPTTFRRQKNFIMVFAGLCFRAYVVNYNYNYFVRSLHTATFLSNQTTFFECPLVG